MPPRPPPPLAEVIKTKGMEKIEVEDLVREITPHGRGTDSRRDLHVVLIVLFCLFWVYC